MTMAVIDNHRRLSQEGKDTAGAAATSNHSKRRRSVCALHCLLFDIFGCGDSKPGATTVRFHYTVYSEWNVESLGLPPAFWYSSLHISMPHQR
jgi:hypothetical protein